MQVSAEALRVCEQLVRVIRPDVGAPVDASMQVRGQRRRDGTGWLHTVGQLPILPVHQPITCTEAPP